MARTYKKHRSIKKGGYTLRNIRRNKRSRSKKMSKTK